jgi:kumamolisin
MATLRGRIDMAYVALAGNERTLTTGLTVLGNANPRSTIQVTIEVKSSQDPTGDRLAAFLLGGATADANAQTYGLINDSVMDRKHLTRQQFASTYGITASDVATIRKFAREHNLRVVHDSLSSDTGSTSLARRTVELRGSVGAFSKAFKVSLLRVRDAHGRVYRVQQGAVQIPQEYQNNFANVLGLDNRPQASPRIRPLPRLGGSSAQAGAISYAPNSVAQLYNFPAGLTGTGQTIALIELGGGARRRDLTTYFQGLGIQQPTVKFVGIGSGANSPTGNPDGDDAEVMLDIEVAGSVAPGATIVVYFAPNTNRGFFRAINAAVHDTRNSPSIISISWGGPEATYSSADITSFNNAFQAAAAVGVSVFVAAGDSGLTDGVSGNLAHVDFPASSPFVTACGGTRLNSSGSPATISGETVWNDGASGGGTGGGISDIFPPPVYQQGVNLPPSLNPGAAAGRGVPDVSGNADPVTGYQIRVDGIDSVVGGTSAVAPLWAGLFALINEGLGTSAGFANTLLYSTAVTSTAGAFNDITQGNNDTTGQFGGQYAATTGWDPCTGLGTPNGTLLLNAIKAS